MSMWIIPCKQSLEKLFLWFFQVKDRETGTLLMTIIVMTVS